MGYDVLKESCEGDWMSYAECSQDAIIFKGVFVRYCEFNIYAIIFVNFLLKMQR